MNRRNFFKGLCALAVAPLALRALPESPEPVSTLSHGPEPALDMSIIRKIEAQLTNNVEPYDSLGLSGLLDNPALQDELARCGYKINYKALHRAIFELGNSAWYTDGMIKQNFEDGRP
jgi:hypothetical protein